MITKDELMDFWRSGGLTLMIASLLAALSLAQKSDFLNGFIWGVGFVFLVRSLYLGVKYWARMIRGNSYVR